MAAKFGMDKTRWLIFLLALGGALPAAAFDYHVSPLGNDTQDGDINNPWQTIARVNQEDFLPGDRVLFEGGQVFAGSLDFSAADAGTPSDPVTVGAYGSGRATIDAGTGNGLFVYNAGGFVVENLIFTGDWDADSQSGNDGDGIQFYMDLPGTTRLVYVRVRDVEVRGFRGAGITVGAWPTDGSKGGYHDSIIERADVHDNGDAGITSWGFWDPSSSEYGHEDLTIRDCVVYRNRGIVDKGSHSGNGIVISDVFGAVIERCRAYENGDLCNHSGGGPVGIWAWDARAVTIQYNESHHNRTGSNSLDGGGFDLDGGVTDSFLQYNYSHDNDGAGYLMWQFGGARPLLGGNTIRYNISENDGRAHSYGGIYIGGGGAVRDNLFYNNTIFVSPAATGAPAGVTIRGVGPGNRFWNNLIVTTGGMELVDVQGNPPLADVAFQGNGYWAGPNQSDFRIRWDGANYSSLNDWQLATGQEMLAAPVGIVAEPQLQSPGGGGTIGDPYLLDSLTAYQLAPGSPMIDAGQDLLNGYGVDPGTADYYGTTIPQGPVLDIGAHEWTGGPVSGAGRVPNDADVAGSPLRVIRRINGLFDLEWSPSCISSDTDYAVYEGQIGLWYSHLPMICTTFGATSMSVSPGSSDSYYLIVPTNPDREGGYGRDSSGAPRPQLNGSCLPQELESCP